MPFIRPKVAKDNSSEWLVWRHALNSLNKLKGSYPQIVIIVPVTAPLRSVGDLRNCLIKYKKVRQI